jgi:methionyl-tRNA synthetase
MEDKRKYFTTTLPYVNARPHIGHAREFVQADVFCRFYKELGFETFLNTGTDEHGLKIYRKSQEEGLNPEEYGKVQAQHFIELAKNLGMKYDAFIRTSDEKHIKAAQEFWKKCPGEWRCQEIKTK